MRTALLFAALGVGAGCPSPATPPSASPTARESDSSMDITSERHVPAPLPTGRVRFQDAYGSPRLVEVEVAATHDSRTRGLMWRRRLEPGKGMLFLFGFDQDHSFWMRNTFIPLDMIFIAQDGRVVGIVENTVPHSLQSRSVGKLSRHVLEVPGGWSAQVGLKTGARLTLELPAGIAIE